MQANIKFNGALILQVQGDGPVKLAVAEAQPDLSFRATAKVVGDVGAHARLEAMLNVHGQGRCAITLDPQDRLPGQQPYQGVVPLHGDRGEPLQALSRCWSTTCCSPSSSTPGWCWPPTTTWPPAC
jgi:molecular chaperone Hsp33